MSLAEEIRESHARAQVHLDNARLLEGARYLHALRFWLSCLELEATRTDLTRPAEARANPTH